MFRTIATPTNISVVWRGEKFNEVGSIDLDLLYHEDVLSWWLSRAVINPENCRGKGIGSSMMNLVKETIGKSEVKHCLVAPGGYSSKIRQQINFYKKNGFVPVKGTRGKLLELNV